MVEIIEKLVTARYFERFILGVILVNAIALGADTFHMEGNTGSVVSNINSICLGIFVIELVLKLIVYRLSFFKDGWNVFDFIIIVLSLAPAVSFLSSSRVLRIFRVFRVFRVTRIISSLKSLRHIVQALIDSLPSVGWTFVLLAIISYVYGIIGTELFGKISPEYFGTLWKSFYTLFQLMMADDLGNITRPIIAEDGMAVIYFISFSFIAIMMVLNVLIGIMVDSIEEVKKKPIEKNESDNHENMDIVTEFNKLKEQMEIVSQLLEKSNNGKGDS